VVFRFLVTGVSGAGKSTLARRLAAWGHHTISADSDDTLCAWTTTEGVRVTGPDAPDGRWLAAHEWR
jgi:adenylate kinase family enzyme